MNNAGRPDHPGEVSDEGVSDEGGVDPSTGVVTIMAVDGIPEVRAGDDLATLIGAGLRHSGISLLRGDIVVVSSKIASKALGLVRHDLDKERVVAGETERVVAERAGPTGATRVVRAKAGPVMAAAGVDGSNTGADGGWLLLPRDSDAVCEQLHDSLVAAHGGPLGVLLSDTSGRPWRLGQSDFALGAHGVRVLDDLRGSRDADGRALVVTTRAVADQLASAADLVKGKASGVPVAVVRGLASLLVEGDPGSQPRGRDLVRSGAHDWFGHGQVEAVRAALGVEAGSDASLAVGLAPSDPGEPGDGSGERSPDLRQAAVGRAVRLALHGFESATVDLGPASVTIGAATAFVLGQVTARLQAALWGEWLEGALGPPTADGVSVTVTVRERPRH